MAQHAIHALALGCMYALLATGLVFLSSAQPSWYLAYGSLYLVGGYATWWALQSSRPIWMALLLALLLCALLGVALTCLARAIRLQHRSERSQLLWGLGVSVCTMEIYRLTMDTFHRKLVATDSPQIHYLGPLMLSDMHWLMFGCAFVCGVCLHGFLTTSRSGLILQAVLDEQSEPPPCRGMAPQLLAIALGASLAGLGGGLAALYLNDIHPELGLRILHKIFCLVIIGGLGHVRGAVLAAFGLACVEGLVAPLTSDSPLPAEAYLLLALFAVSLWPRFRPVPSNRQDVSPDGHHQVTLDSA